MVVCNFTTDVWLSFAYTAAFLPLSGLSLPLSSSSTKSRELLPQFSTCSGWRWFDVVSKTLCCRKIKSVFRDVKWCFNASSGLKGFKYRNKSCSQSAKELTTTHHQIPCRCYQKKNNIIITHMAITEITIILLPYIYTNTPSHLFLTNSTFWPFRSMDFI